MAIVETAMFEPVTVLETNDGSPLSVRAARAFLRNANVLRRYVCNPKLIPGQLWVGGLVSPNASTTETYAASWPALPAPNGFSTIRFVITGQIHVGVGTCTVRLYSDRSAYVGVADLPLSGSIVLTGATFDDYEGTVTVVRNRTTLLTHLYMTFQNSDGATRGRVLNLDAWLEA